MCNELCCFALQCSELHGFMSIVATGLARSPHSHTGAAMSSMPRLEFTMKSNRSIPSKSASKFGKAKASKPGKAPVQRRVNVGKDARSGEALENVATESRASRLSLTRRDVATGATDVPEATNSPTATDSATGANVGEPTTDDAESAATARKKTNAKAPMSAKAPKPAKAPRPAKQPKERKPKRVSAIDAAATILADTGKAMRATELIAEMESRGLWKSPGGKTPESTLYAAISREIAFKGEASRFTRGDKGFFIARKAG